MMTQKQKGYVGLGVMLALGVGTVLGSDPLYKAIDVMSTEKVNYTPGTYVGSAQGFAGEVVATVTVGASGVESVELAGAAETPDFGGAALEKLAPAFVESNSSKVDVVAGATISSNAAIEAVQQALDQAAGKIDIIEREAAPETEAETKAEKKDSPAGGNYKPGTYEGSAQGFGGEIKAKVVIGEGGIESVELTGDGETPGLGADALEKLAPAFAEAGSADVDIVAGSTVSSEAAIKAVQAALDQAAGGGEEKAPETQAPKAEAVSYVPGTYEGSAKGFGGDVTAKVVIGESGIESVELTGKDETPGLGADALEKLEGAFVEAGSADVDGVAGATISSDAAKKAVEAALEGAVDGAAEASA
ncbi:MAG: FMN-binding protein, partial [Hungatella sp.]|nr:FMN-binding protein [Hungatella sp.]